MTPNSRENPRRADFACFRADLLWAARRTLVVFFGGFLRFPPRRYFASFADAGATWFCWFIRFNAATDRQIPFTGSEVFAMTDVILLQSCCPRCAM
jgi:hypothetical protein